MLLLTGNVIASTNNTVIGSNSCYGCTNGTYNSVVGSDCLTGNCYASYNCVMGGVALQNLTGNSSIGLNNGNDENTVIGVRGFNHLTAGSHNTSLGANTGLSAATGNYNTYIGYNSGTNGAVTGAYTGSGNIYLGCQDSSDESNVIRLGNNSATLTLTTTSAYMYGVYGVTTTGGVATYINSSGQLGTVVSSRRYKTNIETINNSESIYRLNPVQFIYKSDINKNIQYGLIAEEVNEVLSDIVIKNNDGECETVQYDKLIPLLLNESIKLKKEIENFKQEMENMKKEMENMKKRNRKFKKLRIKK
jgi:hypothetical protein